MLTVVAAALLAVGLARRSGGAVRSAEDGVLAPNPVPATMSLGRTKGVVEGMSIPVRVARGGPRSLAWVDLYDGERHVDSAPVDASGAAVLSWVAVGVGPHLLHATVRADDGATGFTPTVGVTVSPGIGNRGTTPTVAVRTGETVGSLRQRIQGVDALVQPPGAPTASSRASGAKAPVPAAEDHPVPAGKPLSPDLPFVALKKSGWVPLSGLSPDTILSPSVPVVLDPTSFPAPPAPGEQAPPPSAPGSPQLPITPAPTSATPQGGAPSPPPSPGPAAQGLTVVRNEDWNCNAQFTVTGTGGKEVRAIRTSNTRPVPTVVDTNTGDGNLAVGLPAGLSVVVFRTDTQQSAPFALSPSAGCRGQWTGNVTLIDGILTLPSGGDVYLYMGIKGKPASRVPAMDQSIIKAGKVSDISELIPRFVSEKGDVFVIEAWRRVGWSSSEKIGEGSLSTERGIEWEIGAPTQLTLEIRLGDSPSSLWDDSYTGDTSPTPRHFRWRAASPDVKWVVWQVLTVPLSPANTDLAPLGVLASGLDPWDSTQEFDIPSASLDLRADDGSLPKGPGEVPVTTPPTAGAVTDAVKAGTEGPVKVAQQILAPDKDVPVAELVSYMQNVAPGPVGRVYIRVLGLTKDGTPTGMASNLVTYEPPLRELPDAPRFTVEDGFISVPWRANPDLASCTRVTVPWTGALAQGGTLLVSQPGIDQGYLNAASASYPRTGTYCPGDFPYVDPCPFWCQVANMDELLAAIWDHIAAVYNGLADSIGQWIAENSPICGWVGDVAGSKTTEEECKTVVKATVAAVVKAVMTAVGLPPVLPTSEELKAIADGKVEELALSLVKQIGVPCDDLTLTGLEATAALKALDALDVPPPKAQQDAGEDVLGVCEAIIHAVWDEAKAQAKEAMNKEIVESSGMPSYPMIAGLTIAPEPFSLQQPALVLVVMKLDPLQEPKNPKAHTFDLGIASLHYRFGGATATAKEVPNGGETYLTQLPFGTKQSPNHKVMETMAEIYASKIGVTDGKGRWFAMTVLEPLESIKNETISYGQHITLRATSYWTTVQGMPYEFADLYPGLIPDRL